MYDGLKAPANKNRGVKLLSIEENSVQLSMVSGMLEN